ncbi:Ankyrin protein [Phytophthora cinnamomi]|uniref:Ankyrin protein n=1 Tax=Phytophthora cinnamomi TaxID=4785 RepID=UPI0035598766|nr:Ankyrin protein [Phytophthora cinnamomi]
MSINGWSVEDVYETVRGFGFRGRCLTLLLAMVHFLFVLAIPILCCLKVDKLISNSWRVVFSPLWVLNGVYYGSLLFSLVFANGKLYAFVKELLLLVVEVFIALRLDGVVDWSLVTVLAPYFLYEALNLLETVTAGVLGHQMLVNDTVGASFSETAGIEEERRMLVKAVVRKTIMTLLRVAQALLIGMKVDGSLDATSWWRVMMPVWVLVAYLCWYPIKKYINSTSAHRLLDAVFTAGIILMLVAPFFLLADRLEGKTMSSFDIIMPWMLLMGVSFLFLFCAISLAGSERLVQSGVQPSRQHGQSPPYRHDYIAVDMD